MLKKEPNSILIPRISFALATLVLSATPGIIDQHITLLLITSIFFLSSLTYIVNINDFVLSMILTLARIATEVFYMIGLFIVIVNVLLLKDTSKTKYLLGYSLFGVYICGLLFMVWRNYREMKNVY